MMNWLLAVAACLAGVVGMAEAKSVEWDPNGSGNWYGANRWKGGGTIDGFAFSADSTLDLRNVELTGEWPLHLPITLKNSTGFAGREWAVSVDGAAKRGLYATVTEDGIDVWKKGTVLIFR